MKEYPLEKAFMFIEPGPVVLVTTAGDGRPNIMTISWTMVLDFSPRFAFMTGPWNHSYEALKRDGECVISIPTVRLAEKTVRIGSCSGKDTDKFKEFRLTPVRASEVRAPLIEECCVNLECGIIDHIERHGIFVLDCKKAWIDEKEMSPRFFHAIGDGRFIGNGEKMDYREIMIDKLPPGV